MSSGYIVVLVCQLISAPAAACCSIREYYLHDLDLDLDLPRPLLMLLYDGLRLLSSPLSPPPPLRPLLLDLSLLLSLSLLSPLSLSLPPPPPLLSPPRPLSLVLPLLISTLTLEPPIRVPSRPRTASSASLLLDN